MALCRKSAKNCHDFGQEVDKTHEETGEPKTYMLTMNACTIILAAILSFFPYFHNLIQTGSGKEEAHEHMQTEFGNTTGRPK